MRVIKLILVFGIVAALGYGADRFWKYAKAPEPVRSKNEDLQFVLGGRAARDPTPEPDGSVRYRGSYMTFKYPARAKIYPLPSQSAGILERIDLEIKEPRLSVVAVASAATEKTLDEVSGVMSRRNQKDVYKEEKVIVGPDKTPVFTRLDGTEKTVFVLYNGRLFTLAITGNNTAELASLWNQILPTFHFL